MKLWSERVDDLESSYNVKIKDLQNVYWQCEFDSASEGKGSDAKCNSAEIIQTFGEGDYAAKAKKNCFASNLSILALGFLVLLMVS